MSRVDTDAEVAKAVRKLASGGDARLRLSGPEQLNQYGCSFQPQNIVSFSSCTASTVTAPAFEFVCAIMRQDENQEVDWIERFQSLRDRIRAILGLVDQVDIALGPSGTDLETIASLAVWLAHGAVTNVVVAPEEIGSGSMPAASGLHFSPNTPFGKQVQFGSTIEGFEAVDLQVEPESIRDDVSGEALPNDQVNASVARKVAQIVEQGRVCLLHLVYMSKTGLVYPSVSFVEALKAQYGDRLQVVVDCCQGRVSRKVINGFLAHDFMVLFTGSKFFSGVSFSGALFVPRSLAEVFRKKAVVPEGLKSYFSRAEFPRQWISFDPVLPSAPNLGLYYRWETAIYEMSLFFRTDPEKFDQTFRVFNDVFSDIVAENRAWVLDISPEVQVNEAKDEVGALLLGSIKTIEIVSDGFTYEDAQNLHKVLVSDCSTDFAAEAGSDGAVLSEKFQLGQPVKVRRNSNGAWVPTLRFALGAPFFVEFAGKVEAVQVQEMHSRLSRAFKKISILINGS